MKTIIVDKEQKYQVYYTKFTSSGKHVRVMYAPLNPTFIQQNWKKLGYAGVYLFFLFLLRDVDCGCSLEPPRRGGSSVYPRSVFWA